MDLSYRIVLFFITARRYAIARYICCRVCVCVRYARYCMKTAKPKITQTTPHDSYEVEVFIAKHLRKI